VSQEFNLDPYQFVSHRLSELTPEFEWSESVDREWSQRLISKIRSILGLDQLSKAPVSVQILEKIEMEGYSQQTLVFETQPGLWAYGYLLTPIGLNLQSPAMICVPGHGAGVDAIVGIAPKDYQNQFALQSVKAGFVTLAIEQISFGHRMTKSDRSLGSSCVRDSMASLMLGESMIGWRCFDAMCAYDLLASLPCVDPNRIGIMGISGGGLTAFWTACLDQRFAAAMVSGYFNTFRDSILAVEHCPDNFAFGLSHVVEMPDLVALMAPRKLFVESGTDDPIFPQDAFNRACEVARRIYKSAGAEGSFASHLFEGDHVFNGSKGIPKLRDWLM